MSKTCSPVKYDPYLVEFFLIETHVKTMERFKHILFLLVCSLYLTTAVPAEPDRPNIVWLCGEDLGAQLGQYGYDEPDTPNIDRLASKSLTYDVAWSNNPVCAPARTTLATGMYANSLGAEHMRSWVEKPDRFRLYPNLLRDAGYETINHGKEDYNVPGSNLWSSNNSLPDADEPFFIKLNFGGLHESGVGHEAAQVSGDVGRFDIPDFHPDIPEIHRNWATYFHKIEQFDAWVGNKLETLKSKGLLENTIVVLWGDHGPGIPFGKRFANNFGLQVPLIVHVPESLRENYAPTEYEPGGRTERPVSFVDFGPTMLSIAGQEPPEYMHGKPFMGPHEEEPRDYVFGFRGRMDERIDMVRTVRDERYQLIRNYMPHRPHGQHLLYLYRNPALPKWQRMYEQGEETPPSSFYWKEKPPVELYDLHNDPDQVRNLAHSPEHQDVRERLMKRLRDHLREIRDVGFLPEAEIHRRPEKGQTPFEMAKNENQYPLDLIMKVAEMGARRDMSSVPELAARLDHDDPAVQYWAATGLLVRGQRAVWPHRDQMRTFVQDEKAGPTARVVAAESLARYGNEVDRKQALQALIKLGNNHKTNQFTAIAALNAVDKLDHLARPVLDQILELPSRPENGPKRAQKYTARLLKKTRSDLLNVENLEDRVQVDLSRLFYTADGDQAGLTGAYYDGTDFDRKLFERRDEAIDFDWGEGAPREEMEPDRFSVRWNGEFRPEQTGRYLFLTWSDDGVRLRVNGEQLIDDWTGHATQRNMGAIRLEGGTSYDLKLEYFEGTGSADVRFGWTRLP